MKIMVTVKEKANVKNRSCTFRCKLQTAESQAEAIPGTGFPILGANLYLLTASTNKDGKMVMCSKVKLQALGTCV